MKEKLLILGSSGMVGSSVVRLAKNDFRILSPSRRELDLFDKIKVDSYFQKKNHHMLLTALQKLEAYMPILRFQLILFMKIF